MAKTKPIGVRFDEDLLIALSEDGIADTAQQALNFLSLFYRDNNPNKINFAEKFKDIQLKSKTSVDMKNFNKVLNETPKEVKQEVSEMLDNFDNEEIQKQIAAVKAEKIPPERNTPLGKKIWEKEQSNRINELKKQLK